MRTLSLLLVASTICSAVTPPDQIKVPAGYKVELLREAGPDEGSWICMTQDDQGQLYISTQGTPKGASTKDQGQWGGIWRTTIVMTENPTGNIQPHVVEWEKVNVPVGDAMGMLWAFDSLYVSGMGPQGRGIYRCKSSKGDGNLDTATLFKAIPGGAGEHGAHAIVLGPDKKLYIVNGNSTGILDGLDPGSPYRHWGEDDLLPRLRDPVATFFDKLKAPYGCVYRTDADGTKWELFAGGFRNPYDIAFNPDGELFTYDSDMEWDRGLPWYRPTRILHVVPGGEYGFREGSAKWPAYFPDSLPPVADIGVGCPTGMKFGTEAKGWPEKYRRALFLHDWTYGRILAVTLHEKGASYTARNDLASYTYPRDAEANHDVEVFLSGKGMPVTDLEFLRDGSMVFTVGGRGTAAALYRVSYAGGNAALESGRGKVAYGEARTTAYALNIQNFFSRSVEAIQANPQASSPELQKEVESARREMDAELARKKANSSASNPAPEAQRKLAGGAASEASATTGSPPAKASAPDGARDQRAKPASLHDIERAISRAKESLGPNRVDNGAVFDALKNAGVDLQTIADAATMVRGKRPNELDDPRHLMDVLTIRTAIEHLNPQFLRFMHTVEDRSTTAEGQLVGMRAAIKMMSENPQDDFKPSILINGMFITRLGNATHQVELLKGLNHAPLSKLDDFLKPWKLRVLELSFARQGRPSEERVKALMEELLAHYPVPPFPANAATPARNPAAGAPVDDPAWRLNRELCALLTWLSNPELGALNAELAPKPGEPAKAPANGKTGDFRPYDDALGRLKGPFSSTSGLFARNIGFSRPSKADFKPSKADFKPSKADFKPSEADFKPSKADFKPSEADFKPSKADFKPSEADFKPSEADFKPSKADFKPSEADFKPSEAAAPPSSGIGAPDGALLLAQAGNPARPAADTLPTEAPPIAPGSHPAALNSGLGPVPNPGADIFPGRKPAPFQTELGRQVIEKTLALMEAAPSQEEQIWYALCLRWAHGWTPELRVRYFRWFHEKASRYTGGNSFAKFVEAIRADAASRVPEADRAALAQWLRPIASPVPAVALKPRDFVKAWTLPELEAALDKLKDRKPDLARGKDLYTQAQCAQCHLFRDAGGNVGPDLTAVAQRFGRHDILEAMTDPSKVVSEQYAMVTLTVLDGKGGTAEVSGLVKEESSATITLLTDPLAGKTSNLYKNVIVKREKAAVSSMPPGLLYTLTAEEIADLLALFGAK